ncbi:MAG: hypothetical protein CVU47_12475 [Chloroflexi bacterium HGW-Chloroflexi-9]|nr:MAG: hypothetical protein CVU47_12475 [Chloroflexi bacterium HGW-Chloroflexi-9]
MNARPWLLQLLLVVYGLALFVVAPLLGFALLTTAAIEPADGMIGGVVAIIAGGLGVLLLEVASDGGGQ